MRRRASLYARLSRAADSANTSLEGMLSDMRDLAAREGLEVVAEHVDDGFSGAKRDRPGFTAWLQDAREGRAEVLICPTADRLSREGLNVAASILDVVEGKDPQTGKQVRPAVRLLDTKGIDSDHGNAWRIQFTLLAEVAKAERDRISDRARLSVRRQRQAGRWPGGTVPMGYRAVQLPEEAGWTLEVAPDEAEVLRECAQRVLGGQSLNTVTRWLNTKSSVKPRRAAEFTATTLRQVLTGDAVAGRVTINGQTDYAPVYEPVLTAEQSAALKALLAPTEGRRTPRERAPKRLLSGLLTCHSCGGVLRVNGAVKVAVYRCVSRYQGKTCAQPVAVSVSAIEKYVEERVLSMIGDNAMTQTRREVVGRGDLVRVEQEIKDVMADIAIKGTPQLFQRLTELQVQRAELSNVEPETRTVTIDLGITGATWWERALLEERRSLIADIWPVLELLPGKPGRKGFDPDRLVLRHGAPDLAYESWLQGQ